MNYETLPYGGSAALSTLRTAQRQLRAALKALPATGSAESALLHPAGEFIVLCGGVPLRFRPGNAWPEKCAAGKATRMTAAQAAHLAARTFNSAAQPAQAMRIDTAYRLQLTQIEVAIALIENLEQRHENTQDLS